MTAVADHAVVALPVPDLSDAALAAVTAEVAATAQEYDRSGAIPEAGLAAAHRAGLLSAAVGTRFRGPGVGLVDRGAREVFGDQNPERSLSRRSLTGAA